MADVVVDVVVYDVLCSLEKTDDGKFVVSLKYPHYLPIMKLCQVWWYRNQCIFNAWFALTVFVDLLQIDETRKTMETAFNSRCIAENTPILEELVRLRHEMANVWNGYLLPVVHIIDDCCSCLDTPHMQHTSRRCAWPRALRRWRHSWKMCLTDWPLCMSKRWRCCWSSRSGVTYHWNCCGDSVYIRYCATETRERAEEPAVWRQNQCMGHSILPHHCLLSSELWQYFLFNFIVVNRLSNNSTRWIISWSSSTTHWMLLSKAC